MPIDPSIPLSVQPPKFNSPFETLGQLYNLREMQQRQLVQQQQLQTAQALEEDRRQKIKKEQQQEQDQQTLDALIKANPDRPALREAIRTGLPEHLEKFDNSMAALDEKAAIATKNLADARLANSSAGEKIQSYFAALGSEVAAHGNTPLALKAAGDHALATFPDSSEVKQRVEQAYQQVMQGTPIETITKGLIALNPTQARQQNEAPGQVADAAVKTQVAAGTVGGITPQEQATNANAVANREAADTRAAATLKGENDRAAAARALQERALNIKGGANVSPEDVAYFVRQYQNDPAATEKALSGNPPLKQAVQKGLVTAGANLETLTNQSKQMRETATQILPQIAKVQGLAQQIDQAGLMGTVGGRVRDVSSKESWASALVGLTPAQRKIVGQFQSESGLLISAIARAHGGARAAGSPQMIAQMKDLLGATNSDLPTYLGKLAGAKDWMQEYANMGRPDSGVTPPPGATILRFDAQGNPVK